MMVYVLNNQGRPLMPCRPVIARLLLKQGKAKVKGRTPFTNTLNYELAHEYMVRLTARRSCLIGSCIIRDVLLTDSSSP